MPAALIDVLLNLVPDNPTTVLSRLEQNPDVAAQRDAHGYSLLHAAASYGKLDLARALVQTYNVSVNITDEDGDTPLFAAENPDVAKFFVEELGADLNKKNEEGLTALDKMDDEGEFPLVAAYLRQKGAGSSETATDADSLARSAVAQETNGVHPPPPLPEGVTIQMGTMPEQPADETPDPEFRRRIEELAAREDFQGEEGQRQLRELVQDAVLDMASAGREREVRRRVE